MYICMYVYMCMQSSASPTVVTLNRTHKQTIGTPTTQDSTRQTGRKMPQRKSSFTRHGPESRATKSLTQERAESRLLWLEENRSWALYMYKVLYKDGRCLQYIHGWSCTSPQLVLYGRLLSRIITCIACMHAPSRSGITAMPTCPWIRKLRCF